MADNTFNFTDSLVLRSPTYQYTGLNYDSENLMELFSCPQFKEAIFLASPSLHKKLIKFLNGEIPTNEQPNLIVSLVKYHIRMSTRCTPFGLFSGCSTLKWDNISNISFTDTSLKESRLDMNITIQFINSCLTDRHIRKLDTYYPNSSLRLLGTKYQYIETFYKNGIRKHRLCSIVSNKFLNGIISLAEDGVSLIEVINTLIEQGVYYRNAYKYALELINAQVLVSSLSPTIVGEDMLLYFYTKLNCLPKGDDRKKINGILLTTELILNSLRKMNSPNPSYQNISEETILELERKTGSKYSSIFQLNSFPQLTETSSLNIEIQRDLLSAINLLRKLQSFVPNGDWKLDNFKRRFINRYDEQEVPLMEVLDFDTGLGYSDRFIGKFPSILIQDLDLPISSKENGSKTWTKTDSFLLKHLQTSMSNGISTIKLTDEDFMFFNEDSEDLLPDTMSVMFSLLDKSTKKSRIHLKTVCGPTSNMILGRFTTGNSKIADIAKEIAEYETLVNPNSIVAEIVHLPEDRTGNVLTRIKLREYEIPIISLSQNDPEFQIKLDDILVSVVDNKIVLRSKKHGKEIIPRLSNAHSYSKNALTVYQFLCDIQHQNSPSFIGFDWGVLKTEFSYFPRVEINNVIVSPAQWRLKKDKFSSLLNLNEDQIMNSVENWLVEFSIPKLFLLTDRDNFLLVNTEDFISVKMFISELKNKSVIYLEEFLFDAENGSPNEFVAPILISKKENTPLVIQTQLSSRIKRNFEVGSEWLFYKIYSGEKVADEILLDGISPAINKMKRNKLITHWFFIRYSDPDTHLRVRFHLTNPNTMDQVIKILNRELSKFLKSNEVRKLQIDTYEREMERYDPLGIESAEYLFGFDTECTIALMEKIKKYRIPQGREIIAFKAIDQLLDDFKLELDEKLKFANQTLAGYSNEFNPNSSKLLRKQLNAKYSMLRPSIEKIMQENSGFNREMVEIINIRSSHNTPVVESILNLISKKRIKVDLFSLLSSYIHMNINRLIINDQRFTEYVIYELLTRYYTSQIARQKSNKFK